MGSSEKDAISACTTTNQPFKVSFICRFVRWTLTLVSQFINDLWVKFQILGLQFAVTVPVFTLVCLTELFHFDITECSAGCP